MKDRIYKGFRFTVFALALVALGSFLTMTWGGYGLSTQDGTSGRSSVPVNDAYGSKTATAGTAITRVIPPRAGARACIGSWCYKPAATAHTLTFMQTVDVLSLTSDAAASQAVIAVNRIPVDPSGGAVANTDFFVFQYEDGDWDAILYSSVSGLNITLGSNLSKKVLAGTPIYYMAAPGDHPSRQITTVASTQDQFNGGDSRTVACAAIKQGVPILFHSDNATNAGTLRWLSFFYD